MPIQTMIIPPAYATNMIAGRHNLGLHIANAELLHGVASRWRAYPFGVVWDGDVYGDNGICYTGMHRYREDATILHWDGSGTAGADHLNLTLQYNSVTVLTHEVDAGSTEDFSGTHDLSDHGLTDGYLYSVTLSYETEARTGSSITFACPYTTQAGTAAALTFTAPHAIADGDVSAAADEFTAWRNNDLYFQVCLPSDPAGCMLTKGFSNTDDDPFYWGWLPERFDRIYYKVVIDTNDANSHVHIIYDPGGANEAIGTITALGTGNETFESSFVLDPYAAFSEGTVRQVTATVTKGGVYNGNAQIYYIRNAPVGDESLAHTYTTLAEIAAGDALPGSTTTKRLTYLNDNQNWLDHGYAIEGRQDYAVASTNASYYDLDGYDFIRRGDTLNYRVSGGTLTYTGGTAVTLLDYGTDLPACGYHTLDLTSLSDLAYGMEYRITTSGGPLHWAEES